jgi:hypothetical protein
LDGIVWTALSAATVCTSQGRGSGDFSLDIRAGGKEEQEEGPASMLRMSLGGDSVADADADPLPLRSSLSSEGVLYTCLFASFGIALRALLRNGASNDELQDRIRTTWLARGDRYSELRADHTAAPERKIEMYYIGG